MTILKQIQTQLDVLEGATEKIKRLTDLLNMKREPIGQPKTVALVIGHKASSQGAVNRRSGITEFMFNSRLAEEIADAVQGVNVKIVYRRTYKQLPDDINALNPDFIISLHGNSASVMATGTEVLYYHKSQRGMEMAGILQVRLVKALGLPDRGIKPKSVEQRGGPLLRYTKAPAILGEPFFIHNDNDFTVAQANREALVVAYASAIEEIAKAV